jgi:hypothetical protein
MKPWLEKGMGLDLKDPVIFTQCFYVHWQGRSIAWEVFGNIFDFHADNIWRDTHQKRAAAE